MSKIICILTCLIALTCATSWKDINQSPLRAERIYFDSEEMPMGEDAFHIHVGDNEWIQSSCVHRDTTGFFTYSSDVKCDNDSVEYQRSWKCPYCNKYWPIGSPCGNAACPSKYR